MQRAMAFILAGLTAGAAAYAQEAGEDASPTTKTRSAGNQDQIVCISEKYPGSLIVRRRVCRTRAEWAEHQSQAREVTERVQNLKLFGR